MERVAVGRASGAALCQLPAGRGASGDAPDAAGRHIGKIVLTPPSRGAVRSGVTYLITGGLGGIGLAVADWLADRGATHIVLNSRRAPDAAASAAVTALRGRGVTVEVHAGGRVAGVGSGPAVSERSRRGCRRWRG